MRHLTLAAAAALIAIPATTVAPLPGASAEAQRYYEGRTWRGQDGRLYCRRPNGTTGLIVGAAGGALVGRAIDTRGERATGTIIGAAAGALLGRRVERTSRRVCR